MSYQVEKDWITAAGLHAVVLMTEIGHRCGYVGVPPAHKLDGLSYDDVDAEVHGGLTYSGRQDNYPIASNLWWFGYDCAHLGDGKSPEYIAAQREKYPDHPFLWIDHEGVHCTLAYCEKECESLARQLMK